MQPRSLATRLIAPAAAVLLTFTVAGCGSEVEGTATSEPDTSSSTHATSQQGNGQKGDGSSNSSGSSSSGASSSTAKSLAPLEVTEDLGLNRRLGAPERRLSRCNAPAKQSLPRGKAAAVFKSSRGGLLIKYVLAGELDTSKLSMFTFATNQGKNQRLVGLRNGVIARNSAVVEQSSDPKLKGEYQYRGWTRMEPTADGMILWVEIPPDISPAFQTNTWTGSLTVDGVIVSSCTVD